MITIDYSHYKLPTLEWKVIANGISNLILKMRDQDLFSLCICGN